MPRGRALAIRHSTHGSSFCLPQPPHTGVSPERACSCPSEPLCCWRGRRTPLFFCAHFRGTAARGVGGAGVSGLDGRRLRLPAWQGCCSASTPCSGCTSDACLSCHRAPAGGESKEARYLLACVRACIVYVFVRLHAYMCACTHTHTRTRAHTQELKPLLQAALVVYPVVAFAYVHVSCQRLFRRTSLQPSPRKRL